MDAVTTQTNIFPDGTPMDPWFFDAASPEPDSLGRQYRLCDHGIFDDGRLYTNEIQALIDTAAARGGGVIVVPAGTYLTGALFFKQGVHLYICEGGVLKGSDDIADYPLLQTRIEGESCLYFAALINADRVDGFTMCGPGTIDGNGLRSWKAFWLRRQWNPACTNKDEQRPRLVHISNSGNVTVAGLTLRNSHFWTNHLYRCHHIKYIGCSIFSPAGPVGAPSTDAIDIDACQDVLVKDCYMEVNDDGVVLKGGKGPWADTRPENGANQRVLIEDCTYGFCHSCLTMGSESIHNRNVVLRRCQVRRAWNLLWCKLRPDTPQLYEHVAVEGITGEVRSFINIHPWTQFFDLKGRTDKPVSTVQNITLRDCECSCKTFFDVVSDPSQYILRDFTLERLRVTAETDGRRDGLVCGMHCSEVQVVPATEDNRE